ncbi:MAG: ATP-binding cassette domain-containing protein [candidate division WOR-3 bacterium]
MIQLKNVSKYFRKRKVLSDISFEVEEGEFVAIIGPNGAGKSTLLKIINGILSPEIGEVKVFGLNPAKSGIYLKKNIGFVFQNEFIPKDVPLSVEDVVSIGRIGIRGVFKKLSKEDLRKIEEVMEEVGIIDLRKRPAGFLSGGEQKKLSIARELAREVRILLLDELLTNLDPASQMEINNLIFEVYKRYKLTIVFVTHLLRYLPKGVNRFMALKKGKIFFDSLTSKVSSKDLANLYDIDEENLRKYVGFFEV